MSIVLFCYPQRVGAQENVALQKDSCDPITKLQFFRMLREFKTKMDRSEEFSAKNTITMVRVYNTTFVATIADDSSHAGLVSGYRKVFKSHYFDLLAKKYNLGFTKGMGYLIDLDIYVGSSAPVRCRDLFTIGD